MSGSSKQHLAGCEAGSNGVTLFRQGRPIVRYLEMLAIAIIL